MKICKNCNIEFDDDFNFCPNCGNKLEIKIDACSISATDVDYLNTKITKEEMDESFIDEYGARYTSDGKKLIKGPTNIKKYRIKEGTKVISDNAFALFCKDLYSIVIPNSVVSIGVRAFWGCKFLQSIEIPNGVVNIGDYAFAGCSKFHTIIIPDTVYNLGNSVFLKCKSLLNLTLSNNITKIGNSIFEECYLLQAITIPEKVTSIGDRAFWDCRSLISVKFGNEIKKIGEFAFTKCESLQSIIIPEHVSKIGKYSFLDCRSLSSLIIKSNALIIEDGAFKHCHLLSEIVVPYGYTDRFIDMPCFIEHKERIVNVAVRRNRTRYSIVGDWSFADAELEDFRDNYDH